MFVPTTKVNPLNATCKEQDDVVADEEALEIRIGFIDSNSRQRIHRSIAFMLRSPGQDAELALGYLFSEHIIRTNAEVMAVDCPRDGLLRIELHDEILLDAARFESALRFAQAYAFNANDVSRDMAACLQPASGNTFQIQTQHLSTLGKNLRQKQNLFHSTGGTHACASFNEVGTVLEVTEDISRHNAMDKLLGRLLTLDALPLRKGGLITSGRATYGLMQKTVLAQSPLLVALGAPSSLAVELAHEFNISLVAFLDQENFNIYHDDDRIIL